MDTKSISKVNGNANDADWMKGLARRDLRHGETVCGGVVFTLTPFFNWIGGKRIGAQLFVPDHSWSQKGIVRTIEASEYSKAQQEAEFLRKAIVDIRLPEECSLICGKHIAFVGGRYYDAVLLGEIRYAKALPELLEVAGHDLDERMKHAALGSVGEIGEPAGAYAPKVACILHFDGSLWIRREAAETLGKLGNPEVVQKIREALEEARMLTAGYYRIGYFYEKDTRKRDLCWDNAILFEKLLISLFKLDNKAGREEIDKSFRYGSGLVDHHTKNAVLWCNTYGIITLPDRMLRDWDFIDVPFSVTSKPYGSEPDEF
jgi:hypothetical protein